MADSGTVTLIESNVVIKNYTARQPHTLTSSENTVAYVIM